MVSVSSGFDLGHEAVGSITSQLGKYYIDSESTNGKASWTGEKSAYSLWYSKNDSRWVLGTTQGKGSSSGWIYSPSATDCVTDYQLSSWNYYHESSWKLDSERAIDISCFYEPVASGDIEAAPFLALIADNTPIEWGGAALGNYELLPMTFNGYGVYRHEYLKYYLFANNYSGSLCVGLDLTVDKCILTIATNDTGATDITAWNEKRGTWDATTHPVAVAQNLKLPLSVDPPCKLLLSSDGGLGQKYPEKMGIYHLIPNFYLHGKPAWKKDDDTYLKFDEEGTWVVSKVSFAN